MAFIEPMHRNKPNITYLLTPPRYRDKVKLSVGQVDFDKKNVLLSLTWKTQNFVRQAREYFSIYEALLL